MTKHTQRYHLTCAKTDAPMAQKALDAALPGWVLLVDLDGEPGLSGASGQWTPEEAAQLLAAVEEIPGVKAWRGPTLGYVEPGVVVVDKGGDASRQGEVRLTVAKAVEETKKLTTTIEGEIRGK